MPRFIVARAAHMVLVAWIVTSLVFVLIHIAPGDPFAASPDDPPEIALARAQLRSTYGLDRPLIEQYPAMLMNFARGNFGESFIQARPVSAVLADAIPRTMLLMGPALLAGLLLGLTAGTVQGVMSARLPDRIMSGVSLAVLSVPEFLIALVASGVLAVRLGWFPATGMMSADLAVEAPWTTRAGDILRHALLPGSTLALIVAAFVSRFQRGAVVEAMQEDFIRAVRAKGLARSQIVVRHVLRRTGATVFTIVGLLVPALVGGAALVESVFAWPGAGSALLRAVSARDYPVVIALVLVGSLAVCIGSALADIGAAKSNPAVRLDP